VLADRLEEVINGNNNKRKWFKELVALSNSKRSLKRNYVDKLNVDRVP
jgi:hypothetical protein